MNGHKVQQTTGKPHHRGDWRPQSIHFKDALMEIIARYGKVKAVGAKKPVSNRTQDWRSDCLFLMFRELREMGIKLASPYNFRENHVKHLVSGWEQRGLSAATIQNRLSVCRMFSEWIGKKGMVRNTACYLVDPANGQRSSIATEDKSWCAKGINVDALLSHITAFDPYVGLQLRLMSTFGLRREEAVMFKPHRADHQDCIRVRDGTKGGRERLVRITNLRQREVLDDAKRAVSGIDGHVGEPGRKLKQALRRFNYVLERFGVTGSSLGITSHGLRSSRLNDIFAEVAGIPSPVRGPIDSSERAQEILSSDPELIELARARVSEDAGHSRLGISGAYIGSVAQAKRAALDWSPQDGLSAVWLRFGQLGAIASRSDEEDLEFRDLAGRLGIKIGNA